MSYKENGARRAPRLPQSPTKFSHGIVNIQTSSSNVRSNNVHSNRFTSNLSGRFFLKHDSGRGHVQAQARGAAGKEEASAERA